MSSNPLNIGRIRLGFLTNSCLGLRGNLRVSALHLEVRSLRAVRTDQPGRYCIALAGLDHSSRPDRSSTVGNCAADHGPSCRIHTAAHTLRGEEAVVP